MRWFYCLCCLLTPRTIITTSRFLSYFTLQKPRLLGNAQVFHGMPDPADEGTTILPKHKTLLAQRHGVTFRKKCIVSDVTIRSSDLGHAIYRTPTNHFGYQSGLLVSCTSTRVGTLIVTTIYLQLVQNRYMFRSFTLLQCSHQHCVQPVASDVEVVGYL